MKVKVCGLREKDNIEKINSLLIDYLGFIFYKKSKRTILDNSENINFIKELKNKVAVFVNEKQDNIQSYIKKYQFDFVQLHGDENPNFCFQIKSFTNIIKAFSVDDNFDFNCLKEYEDVTDFFLFDTKGKDYGGNGISFNWSLLEKYKLSKPFFLSGGISINDIDKIKEISHPLLYCVDINSKFEIKPGLKDVELVKSFLNKIKV